MKYDFDRLIDRHGSGCFKYDAMNMMYGRDDLLGLSVADMDFAIAPSIEDAIRKRSHHPIYGYNFMNESVKEAVSFWQAKRHSWIIGHESIEIVQGVMPALALAILAHTQKGDGILIQTPVYPPFFSVISEHERNILTNSLIEKQGTYSIDFENFEYQAKKAKMFILCNPHNPVGRVFTIDELIKMGEICKKNNVIIFSDEIHADIVYNGYIHTPMASISDYGDLLITATSPAKSFNLAGLSTAAVIAENSLLLNPIHRMNMKLHTYMGNSFGSVAMIAAYNSGDDWLKELVEYLEENRKLVIDYVDQLNSSISISPCEGTYLAWLCFKELNIDDETFNGLLKNKARLAVQSGLSFGEEGMGFFRVNFACPRTIINEAMMRIKDLIGDLKHD